MIAEPVRTPPVSMREPDAGRRRGERVAFLQAELGVREARPIARYGATSHLSEELLWHGYRRAGEDDR